MIKMKRNVCKPLSLCLQLLWAPYRIGFSSQRFWDFVPKPVSDSPGSFWIGDFENEAPVGSALRTRGP